MVAPRPVRVKLHPDEFRHLDGIARERDARRGYVFSDDDWRRGLTDRPTYLGLVGEYACARFLTKRLGFAVTINTDDAPRGDGGVDLLPVGVRIQVKTRTRRLDLLVKRQTPNGRILPFLWDVCVVTTWDRDEAEGIVTLDGFVTRDDLREFSTAAPGKRGPWVNDELPDCYLSPMRGLVDAINLRSSLRGVR